MLITSIPSPSVSEWELGPLTLRAYALCIIAGIVVAIWLGNKRWVARGGAPGAVADIAVWAVPFGIIGARIYHVITDNQLYFGEGRDPIRALYIWEGGLGIWGAIAFGAVGAWIGCRRRGIPLPAMADAMAPGIVLAQALGRWGNWFNNELYGRETDLPWGLEVHRMEGGNAAIGPDGEPVLLDGLYHPTFLYESLWCVVVALVIMWADKRFRLGHGRVFALYVAGYTLGRAFFEYLRIDPANEILGLRVNLWVSGLVFLGALTYIVLSARRRPGREAPEDLRGFYDDSDPFADSSEQPTLATEVPDTSTDDEPSSDEPKDDEPKGDDSKGDEPKGDEPKGDEPKRSAAESGPKPTR